MDEKYVHLFDLARPFLDTRANDEHTRIAYKFACRLLEEEPGNPDIVLPAIILHDVGWKSIPEDLQITAFGPGKRDKALNKVHEQEGARIAANILTSIDYPIHLAEEITAIISGHDSRSEATSVNDAVVKDADKLWRYSEHGVILGMKRFGMTRQQYIKRLKNKLRGWLLTGTGRSIAKGELKAREKSPT